MEEEEKFSLLEKSWKTSTEDSFSPEAARKIQTQHSKTISSEHLQEQRAMCNLQAKNCLPHLSHGLQNQEFSSGHETN